MNLAEVQPVIAVERTLPHPPEKIWRALTTSDLLAEWLMPNDFRAEPGRRFTFRMDPMPHWDGIVRCEVLDCDPPRLLRYSWVSETKTGEGGLSRLDTVVTWTLTQVGAGTLLRMEQDGFGPENRLAYRGALGGWQHMVDRLAAVVDRLD